MPAPITHIVLANKIINKLPILNPRDYYIGTSFPDIRYLGVIDRTKTHPNNPIVENTDTSFTIGLKIHSVVDFYHEYFMTQNQIYSNFNKLQGPVESLKLIEDINLYNKISNWKEIANYFDRPIKEELDLVSDKNKIMLWHQAIRQYLQEPPSGDSSKKFLKKIGFDNLNDMLVHDLEILEKYDTSYTTELYSQFKINNNLY